MNIDQLDFVDKVGECTYFSNTQRIITKTDYMLGHKIANKFKRTEVRQN